jgi:hypothetical protein
LANAHVVPKRSSTQHLDLSWSDRGSDVAALSPRLDTSGWVVPLKELMGPIKHWKAPILYDLPRALAAAIVSFASEGRKLVCCRKCGRCVIGRRNQRFCPGGKCRRAWHQQQPGTKEKRRAYMREMMRKYRAHERRVNQSYIIASRKHVQATQPAKR